MEKPAEAPTPPGGPGQTVRGSVTEHGCSDSESCPPARRRLAEQKTPAKAGVFTREHSTRTYAADAWRASVLVRSHLISTTSPPTRETMETTAPAAAPPINAILRRR